jgi:aspartate beta-hydroxylase
VSHPDIRSQAPPADPRALAQAGVEALRRGDARAARGAFERVIAAGAADATVHLGHAYACNGLNDAAAAMAAVDRALALEPANLPALIFKADRMAAQGDERAALAFYRAAVNAAPPPEQCPAELRGELDRAQAQWSRYAEAFRSHLRDSLRERGLLAEEASARFRDSIDILVGAKHIYVQEPRHYYFPGLPQIQFFDRKMFPWIERMDAAAADIRAELVEVLRDERAFRPYVEAKAARPHIDSSGMLENPEWSAFYLWKHGQLVAENAARCPRTLEALAAVPLCRVKKRSPSVLFSLLRPGARIPPHTGEVNTRLICHLPLVVPPGCTFRVGNETRPWVEGRTWVFDDTIEHEAWNPSDRNRVILLFEVWRPELTESERAQVSAMFETIDASGSAPSGGGL